MTMTMLVLAAAAVTYVSRMGALALLPAPAGWFADVVERLPAPLFAGLAASTLLSDGTFSVSAPELSAAAAALAVVRRKSLVLVLGAGLGAYGLATAVTAAL